MLVSFSVENVLSFRDQVTLDMRATSTDTTLNENVMSLPFKGKTLDLLKSAIIFGPNASGKSNLLQALKNFLFFVCLVPQKKTSTAEIYKPFMLAPEMRTKPSMYEITLLINGASYRYGFVVGNEQVHEEWLFVASIRQERLIFERSFDKCKFGSTGGGFKKVTLAGKVRKENLLLSVAHLFDVDIATIIHDTLRKIMPFSTFTIDTCIEDSLCSYLSLIKYFDTGLCNILFDEDKDTIDSNQTFFKVESKVVTSDPDVAVAPEQVDEINKIKERLEALFKKHTKTKKFIYKDSHGSEVPMPEDSQSSGTLQLLNLCNALVSAYKSGAILVCDEIEKNLHPMACQALLRLLHTLPGNQIQLICTTHNTQILNDDVFRRDQVWITEKNTAGKSSLFSISDFKGVRNNARLGKQYLEGRFGGLPVFNPQILNEFICNVQKVKKEQFINE